MAEDAAKALIFSLLSMVKCMYLQLRSRYIFEKDGVDNDRRGIRSKKQGDGELPPPAERVLDHAKTKGTPQDSQQACCPSTFPKSSVTP